MLNLMVALPAEARPIVEMLRLKSVPCNAPFKLYVNEHYRLLVSGIGQTAMASACGWLAGHGEAHDNAWLNVGVAGHRDLELGSLRVAHRIDDQVLERSWYPPQLVGDLVGERLITVPRVQCDYPEETLYDMEASAFVAVCTRFCTAELVQSVKVVSDNRDHSHTALDAKRVGALIEASARSIIDYAKALADLAQAYYHDGEVDGLEQLCGEIQQRWHFSSTRQNQLRNLMRRFLLQRSDGDGFDLNGYAHCRDAAAFLSTLKAHVDTLPVSIRP